MSEVSRVFTAIMCLLVQPVRDRGETAHLAPSGGQWRNYFVSSCHRHQAAVAVGRHLPTPSSVGVGIKLLLDSLARWRQDQHCNRLIPPRCRLYLPSMERITGTCLVFCLPHWAGYSRNNMMYNIGLTLNP